MSENCALKNSWIAEAAEGRMDGYITGIFAVQHDEAGRPANLLLGPGAEGLE